MIKVEVKIRSMPRSKPKKYWASVIAPKRKAVAPIKSETKESFLRRAFNNGIPIEHSRRAKEVFACIGGRLGWIYVKDGISKILPRIPISANEKAIKEK